MSLLSAEWTARIEHWIRTLQTDFYTSLGKIPLKAMRTKERLDPYKMDETKFVSVQPGFTWGEKWEYCWFCGSFCIPKEAVGKRIVMDLNPGGETTIFVNGKAFGTYRADWIAKKHHYMADNFVTDFAKEGENYQLLMETYAGHFFPNYESCATGPVIPGSYEDPAIEGSRRVLGECSFGIWREEAYQLYLDMTTLYELLKEMDDSSLRAVHIAQVLKDATKVIEFETDAQGRLESYKEARKLLKPAMEATNGSTVARFYAVGNSHLDLAWLWPVEETRKKTVRTFAAQLRLLDAYPEYKFIQSQPAEYELCREYAPELFERILQAIREGRWIADGAMWVEPDTNMSSGESLIRQLFYGKKYYREVLETDSHVLWLPDSFGYTAALPQILKGCDVQYLVTQKIFWSYNEGEQFPYHYFTWEGMDGSKVTSFLPTSYTYNIDPGELLRTWKTRRQKEDLEAFLLPFGYGDGGGGPVRDHVEFAMRQKNLEGSPKVEMVSPEEFFHQMEKEGGPKHTYTGELYFTAHRGTYTVQAKIKKNNRRSELILRELEFWGSLALLSGKSYDRETAERLWKVLLFHQFHDILPGSSIERVYTEANREHEKLQKEAATQTANYQHALVTKNENAAVICNSLPFERTVIVSLPEGFDGARLADGTKLEKDSAGRVRIDVPSMSMTTIYQSDQPIICEDGAFVTETEDEFCMENDKIVVRVNKDGEITSYIRKDSSREFAAGPMNRLHLFRDIPRYFDAWDIDSIYKEEEVSGAFDRHVCIKERSGLKASLLVKGKIGNSSYQQEISLESGSDCLMFDMVVDWNELHRLLKVNFPSAIYAVNAKHEMQFGYVERPTHDSRLYDKDRFEVCNHRYTALTDASHGAVVLNDCKYGINVSGNSMNLTLLRAAASPQMRSDNGKQTMRFAFMGYEGAFADAAAVRAGYEMNVPVEVIPKSEAELQVASVDQKNVILETIKPAEDGNGDLILRLYEACGASCRVNVTLAVKIATAWKTNMLESIKEKLNCSNPNCLSLSFDPFEIQTIRIHPQLFGNNLE